MVKILLTGAEGMLGSALTAVLGSDNEVLVFNKSELDITDSMSVEQKIVELKPDVVVNAAAYTAVDDCEVHADEATTINGGAVKNLAQACQRSGVLLVHFSTDYVFDGGSSEGYAEDADPNPINTYGRSKLAGEVAILQSGCRYVIVRTSWLFGPNGKNFVETMLRLSRKHKEIKIVSDQTGCPTYTYDLAEAVQGLIISGATGIFHLTNAGTVSWADFATEIFQQIGSSTEVISIPTSQYPTPAARPACSVLLNTKLPALRSWQAALGDYLQKI